MTQTLKIDFVSDIACPWCAVGLGGLEQALRDIGDSIAFEIHFQPFELNPQMPVGGQDVIEHLTEKYGRTEEQVRANQANIRARGAAVGFTFHPEGRKWVYNTFNAHRLLHWAGFESPDPMAQLRLKKELLATYFTLAVSLDDQSNLLDAVARAGLDTARAKAVLDNNEFAQEVRDRQAFYKVAGIHAVPAVIINDKYLLEGAQPADAFEHALRRYAAMA